MEVAKEKKTQLKVGMLEDNLNMQSTDLSVITFSKEVQAELEMKGYSGSAELCERVSLQYNFK